MQQQKAGHLGLVAADGAIIGEFLRMGYAEYKYISWSELCFHWANRQGDLAKPAEVPELVSDLLFVGFSPKACSHALCAQAEPRVTTLSEEN